MIRFILMDIEGTTTDINFVHKVLFPYSAERLAAFVAQHANELEVRACLKMVQETVQQEESHSINDQKSVETLLKWIQSDRKHTALKQLQGLIWRKGFENGDYQGHVYDDVPPSLERWKKQNVALGIYSSGSVQAQKLLFGYSIAGDLTPYFSHYFDTNVGAKKEVDAYRKIAQHLNLSPAEILFLSDVEAELDAAATAGFQVIQLVREGTVASQHHPTVKSFAEIQSPAECHS